MTTDEMKCSAVLSPCGRYRSLLTRIWDETKPILCFIQLNPSTADATKNDPTVRKDIGFSRLWFYGGMCIANLYGWRATDPRELWRVVDPIGPDNDAHIIAAVQGRDVLAAWGGNVSKSNRSKVVTALLVEHAKSVKCLGYTDSGQPRHTLYLPYSTPRVAFPAR